MEVRPPMTSGTLVKEVTIAPSIVPLGMEKEPPSGGVTEEVGQPMQVVQPILSSIPLATQDHEDSQPHIFQDPQPMQTLNPTKTMSLEPTTEPALSKKSLGGVSSSIQAGESHLTLINMVNLISFIFSF